MSTQSTTGRESTPEDDPLISHPEPRMDTAGDVLLRRVVAKVIDSVVVLGMLFVPMAAGAVLNGGSIDPFREQVLHGTPWQVAVGSLLFMLIGGYAMLLFSEGVFGQTPGKRLTGLVVVKTDGSRCTIGASVLRNLVLWVVESAVLFLISLGLLVVSDDDRHAGDRIAGTVVTATR